MGSLQRRCTQCMYSIMGSGFGWVMEYDRPKARATINIYLNIFTVSRIVLSCGQKPGKSMHVSMKSQKLYNSYSCILRGVFHFIDIENPVIFTMIFFSLLLH